MTAWWYADKGVKVGPVDVEQLKLLLQAGRITPRTMLWREGMEAWQPLGQIDELAGLEAAVPPPLPPKTDPVVFSHPSATRWLRFLARTFDVWFLLLPVAAIGGAVLAMCSAGYVEWISKPGSTQIVGLLFFPIALFFDALLYRIFGNTPGKSMLGLKVTTLDGKALRFTQYLGRNFSVWTRGYALGIPFIGLFTMTNQFRRLGDGRQASYDESTGYRLRSRRLGAIRLTAFWIAFAIFFATIAVLTAHTPQKNDRAITESLQITARGMNLSLPMMLDADTRLDSVMGGPSKQLTYLYTLVNVSSQNVLWADIAARLAPQVRQGVCSDKEMAVFFENGVRVVYKYRDKNGLILGEIVVAPSDCGY
jgi:uncharacterized RDD family membrane protein YckC